MLNTLRYHRSSIKSKHAHRCAETVNVRSSLWKAMENEDHEIQRDPRLVLEAWYFKRDRFVDARFSSAYGDSTIHSDKLPAIRRAPSRLGSALLFRGHCLRRLTPPPDRKSPSLLHEAVIEFVRYRPPGSQQVRALSYEKENLQRTWKSRANARSATDEVFEEDLLRSSR